VEMTVQSSPKTTLPGPLIRSPPTTLNRRPITTRRPSSRYLSLHQNPHASAEAARIANLGFFRTQERAARQFIARPESSRCSLLGSRRRRVTSASRPYRNRSLRPDRTGPRQPPRERSRRGRSKACICRAAWMGHRRRNGLAHSTFRLGSGSGGPAERAAERPVRPPRARKGGTKGPARPLARELITFTAGRGVGSSLLAPGSRGKAREVGRAAALVRVAGILPTAFERLGVVSGRSGSRSVSDRKMPGNGVVQLQPCADRRGPEWRRCVVKRARTRECVTSACRRVDSKGVGEWGAEHGQS
jgi:hypothetical protein